MTQRWGSYEAFNTTADHSRGSGPVYEVEAKVWSEESHNLAVQSEIEVFTAWSISETGCTVFCIEKVTEFT